MNPIRTPNENRIALEYFRDFVFGTEITKKLYPEITSKKAGPVSDVFNRWNKKGYIDAKQVIITKIHKEGKNKGESYAQAGPAYRLNINFFIDYLKSEKEVKITFQDKRHLKEFLDKPEIRYFLYEWIKNIDNSEKMKKTLAEHILTFIRALLNYPEECMLLFAFDKDISKKYFKIIKIVFNFRFPSNPNKDKIMRNLDKKIEEKFDHLPLLLKKQQVFEPNTNDLLEKEILKYTGATSKKNK